MRGTRVLIVVAALVLTVGARGDNGSANDSSTVTSGTEQPAATIEPSGPGVDPANLAVVAKLTAVPGGRDELADRIESAFPEFEQESGTLVYVVAEDAADADVLWLFEYYRTRRRSTCTWPVTPRSHCKPSSTTSRRCPPRSWS